MLKYFTLIGYILSVSKLLLGCELNIFGNGLKFSGFQSHLINVLKPVIAFKCNLLIKYKNLGFKNPNM